MSRPSTKTAAQRPYEELPRGHVWKTNDYDKNTNIFGYEAGNHNGPECVKCGYGFCHHCHELPSEPCSVVGA